MIFSSFSSNATLGIRSHLFLIILILFVLVFGYILVRVLILDLTDQFQEVIFLILIIFV